MQLRMLLSAVAATLLALPGHAAAEVTIEPSGSITVGSNSSVFLVKGDLRVEHTLRVGFSGNPGKAEIYGPVTFYSGITGTNGIVTIDKDLLVGVDMVAKRDVKADHFIYSLGNLQADGTFLVGKGATFKSTVEIDANLTTHYIHAIGNILGDGFLEVKQDVVVGGILTAGKDIHSKGTLEVDGATTLSGNTAILGTLTLAGAVTIGTPAKPAAVAVTGQVSINGYPVSMRHVCTGLDKGFTANHGCAITDRCPNGGKIVSGDWHAEVAGKGGKLCGLFAGPCEVGSTSCSVTTTNFDCSDGDVNWARQYAELNMVCAK